MINLTMVKTAVSAMWKFIVWRKCRKTKMGSRNFRLHTCFKCKQIKHKEYYIMPAFMQFKCQKCGCFVTLKTWCIDEKCPEGRW